MDERPGTLSGAKGRLMALRDRLASRSDPVDASPPAAQDQPPEDRPATPARICFCLHCGYELTGIDWSPAACPECGEAFDPEDAMSTSAVSLEKARRGAVMRVMVGVLIGLAIVSGLMYTVIPRPERPDNWRLWVWFGQRWGAQPAWMGAGQGWVYWWAGKPYAAEREDDKSGGLVWEMAMDGGDQWTLQVHQPGVEWNELMRPFNAIKRDMFGIVFTSEERKTCTEPFEARGDRIDVMSALARTYGLRTKSYVMTKDQSYVWVFDPSRGRMQALDIEAAQALDYEIDRQPNAYETRKLIPRPGAER